MAQGTKLAADCFRGRSASSAFHDHWLDSVSLCGATTAPNATISNRLQSCSQNWVDVGAILGRVRSKFDKDWSCLTEYARIVFTIGPNLVELC